MAVLQMARSKSTTTLTVLKDDQALVAKVARMRDMSIEKLFTEQDVRDFFTHLLLAEMKKETERLQPKTKK